MLRTLRFAIFFLMPMYLGCSGPDPVNLDKQVFRYNESKGITLLDPAFARNQTIIWPVSQLFNGLVQMDDSLNIQPSIAKSWTISEDGLVYTFNLRNDVRFHPSDYFISDPGVVTAKDFVYSFNRILDSRIASPGAWIFDYMDPDKKFTALNDTTFEIYLDQTFPPFLSILSMPYTYVVPEEIVENEEADFSHNPVGTGPFVFKLWSPDEKLVLVKNPDYFELDDEGIRLPYLDAISITFIKDKQSEFLEFLKGNLDFLSGIHAAYKDELLTRSGTLNPKYKDRIQLLSAPYLNTEYLGILQQPDAGNNQILLDRRIRLAINHGFDREKMMKYLRNNLGYAATGGMIPPGLPGHLTEGEGYSYNPDLSRKLISEADLEDGSAVITLTTTSDYLDICEYIQYELYKIGLQIKIEVSTGGSFRNMVANGNLPFFRGSWIADYADAENYLALFYSVNHAPGGPNYTRFSNTAFDRLYEEAIQLNNDQERYACYRKLDSIIVAESPVIPLYYDMVVRFAPMDIHGFSPNPMNNLILKQVKKTGITPKKSR
ncbi:ABC transporter substrate-binding protein [Bacteroidota bacterium]